MSIAPARREVDHPLVALERAGRLDAARVGLALQAHERAGQRARARRRERPRLAVGRAQRQHRPDDLGDHVAGLAHDHRVAGPDVLGPHLVLVVQRRHRRPSSRRRTPARARRTASPARCARSTPGCREQRRALLGRELVGDRPARRPRRRAEPGPLGDVVDLDDDAVDLVAEVVAVRLPVPAVGGDVVERRRTPATSGLTGKPSDRRNARLSVCRASGGPPTTSPSWYAQNDRSRWAVIVGSFWRRLPAAALRGLTNSRPPAAAAASFIRSKLATGRYTSPRTSSTSGTASPSAPQRRRDGADRGHVGRDVLADPAVAARRRLHVAAALVADAHRDAVDLQLAHEAARSRRAAPWRRAGPTPSAPRRSSRCRGSSSARSARPARTARSARRRRPGRRARRRPARGAAASSSRSSRTSRSKSASEISGSSSSW